jgi:ADP-ribose pyrophosphatase YjhB (NUDIX family)
MTHYCQSCGTLTLTQEVEGRKRDVCPSCGVITYAQWKVSAGVRVVNNGRVLLVKRRFDPYKGKWHMPAGYVEIDETPAQAAEREAREETGLTVQVESLVDCYLDPEDPRGNVIILLFDAQVMNGSLTPSDETEEVGFFSPEQAANLPLAGKSAEIELSDWLKTLAINS